MAKNLSSKPVEEMSYEDAMAELDRIATILEGEQNPLDEAMALFERGQALINRCQALLDQAEVKIKQIVGGTLADFEIEE